MRPAGTMTGLQGNLLDWDRKERLTPAEQRTIFRTIGVVRSDHVPGSAQLELSGGVRSLPQAP
jgi:hypothetical protein